MSKIISASIDVSKITKDKLIKGKKGTYCNIQIYLNDEPDQFGNTVGIAESQTKEERADKEKKTWLGNGKIVWEGESTKKEPVPEAVQPPANDPTDDLPF